MNESAVAQVMRAQLSISNNNTDLDKKLQDLANLQAALTSIGAVNAFSTQISATDNATIAGQKINLEAQVSNLSNSINQSITAAQQETKQL